MRPRLLTLAAVAAIAVAACSPSESPNPSESPGASGAASPGASGSPEPSLALTKVSLRIGQVANAEFAGYVAAQHLGYYSDAGLEVTLVNATSPAPPLSGTSGPEFTIADLVDVLAAREHGSDLVDIAQVFQRSGTVLMTWKKDGFKSACDLRGKKVGLWPAPDDLEVVTQLKACQLGSDAYTRVDVEHDVAAFLDHSVDAIEASNWDGVARVLEATNPTTNAQFTLDDLALFGPTDGRPATLHDGIFARAGWLKEAGNRDTAVAFVAASIQGWVYCRDHQDDCVQFVTEATASLASQTSHQRWMLNAINPLIWPSAGGIGIPDQAQWDQTVNLALAGGVIAKRPSADANDQTIVVDASDQLSDLDLVATGFQTGVVAVAPGGR